MNKLSRIGWIVCALALLLSALGCDSGPRAALYGKWVQDGTSSTGLAVYWEFTNNGELIFTSGEAALRLNYAFLDDDTIEIEESLVSDLGGVPIDWKVEGDRLTLSLSADNTATFTRAK